MRIAEINGFEIHVPTSGGKAGKGNAKTSTIQIRKDNVIVKQFRFVVADIGSKNRAIGAAKKFIGENNEEDGNLVQN
jgi:hypothetical protein